MGEMADAIMEGLMCAGCGEYLGEQRADIQRFRRMAGLMAYCDECRPKPEEPPRNRRRRGKRGKRT